MIPLASTLKEHVSHALPERMEATSDLGDNFGETLQAQVPICGWLMTND